MKRLTSSVLALCVAVMPANVLASPYSVKNFVGSQQPIEIDEQGPTTTYLEKGATAPFAGTLLNPAATARIIIERENVDAQCQIKVDRAVELKRVELQLELDNVRASLETTKSRIELEKDLRARQVEALSTELERTQKQAVRGKWNAAWFAGGVVAGVLVVIAGAFAVRGARETQLQP